MTTNGRALIVGGSLGGLFAAHLLRASGWTVDVFERSTEDLAGRGAGLGTHDGLVAAMRRIGLDLDTSLGVATHSYIWLGTDGAAVREVAFPRVMTAWAHLYRPLRDALPSAHYHPAKSLVRVEQDAHSITALFADGTRATGDLLVAADGARSAARAQLLPEAKPLYAGYIAWRALLAEADTAPADRDLLFERMAFCVPDGELEVSYPVPGRDGDLRVGHRDYNIVWYRPVDLASLADLNTDASGRRHEQIPPPLIRSDVIAAAKAAAHRLLAPAIADIFDRTPQPIVQAIYDLKSPQIAFGRLALLGDAAFVARPHVGAGVTKAALDAACLADALTAHADVGAALADYDRTRRAGGNWIVDRGRTAGECIMSLEASRELSAAERRQHAERAWQEYCMLPGEIRDWSAPVLRGWASA
jgi:2-polyprenyl-6-methoxyphenol hydroxylase-like FAD-dependent oxidoreductase